MPTEKPEYLEDVHLVYLDNLRASGATNMFGAAPYLKDAFDLTKEQSRKILGYWMETFSERKKENN